MIRFSVSMVAASALALCPAHAEDDQVRRGPAPDWVAISDPIAVPADASGAIFVRRQDYLVHLDEQGQAEYLGYRIKILQPDALQLGNISIAWKPVAGAPTVHSIKIYRGDKTIDVLKTASFEILRREGQLEAAMLDGVLTAVLRVADLRVGDELEVGLTTRSNDPTLGKDNAGLLLLGPDPAPGRFRLGLSWVQGQQPSIRMTPDMTAIAERHDRTVDFRFDNPAILSPPKDAPARYGWQRIVEYSDFADWAAISRRFGPEYAKAATLAKDSPVRREASRIAAAHASPIERARAALKMVQQDVRYIYVGIGDGNLIPATADDTWQRRYGDCKGKTALLLALLAALDIKAEAVLANNAGFDDGIDLRLANPGMFDHVLVRARIGGADYWMDGTLPPVVPPGLKPVLPYRWVLPLSTQGSSIERLQWRPPEAPDSVNLFEIDARAGFDKPARITSTTIIRGIKGLEQQVQFSRASAAQLLSSFQQRAVGDTWQEIEDVQWRYDQKAQASILTVSGTGAVRWEDNEDGAKSLALPGGGFSPPDRRVRAAGQGQDLPYYSAPDFSCDVTTVRLPGTTQARQWTFKPGYDTRMFGRNYYRAFELRGGAIRMVRGSRVEQPEIDAATARKDNDRIAAFDNSMAWIFYDPAREDGPSPDSGDVPATYDIDWAADHVPCLSPATMAVADPPTAWSLYNRGIVHDGLGDYQAATADYSAAIRAQGDNADAYFRRGSIYVDNADFEGAVADFTRAHQLRPKAVEPLAARARIYAFQEKEALAKRDFDAVRAIDPFDSALMQWDSFHAFKARDWRGAVASLTAILNRYPYAVQSLASRAYAYRQLGEAEKARADDDRAKELEQAAHGEGGKDGVSAP